MLGERVPAPAPWPPTGQNSSRLHLGSAATARCRTATSCALSGARSTTRAVHRRLGSAPRPAAGEHERSPTLVTLRSEQNVKILSHLLAQLARVVGCHGSTPTCFTVQVAHNTHLQTPQNSRDTLSILYGVRRGGTHAARHYCTLAARRGRSSSLEVEGRELDAAAGGRSEGLLAQSR